MATFHLCILAADKPFSEGEGLSLVVPTTLGQYGILAHHSNAVIAVVPGMLSFTCEGGEKRLAAVSSGLVKAENNEVLVLVETAERPEEIDENRARREADEAKEALLQKKSIADYYAAQARMARALNRLRVKHYDEK